MELHQVRYFLALAELRNFTWAAKQCNVSQPALTKAVQKLEHELGGALIHRERRLTQLTDLGKLVLPMLERTFAAAEAVRQHAEEFRRKKVAPLKIGLSPCVSATLAMGPLAELAGRMPGLQVELVDAQKDDLPEMLLEGAVNVALVGDPGFLPDRIDRWRLFEERILVVAPTWSPIADFQAVPLGALADAVWLDRPACDVTQRFLQAHFPHGRPARVGPRAWKDAHVQDMVLAGLGIMLLPEHCSRIPNLIARPIEGDPLLREVDLLVVAGRRYSPAVEAFVKVARALDWGTKIGRMSTQPPAGSVRRDSDRGQPAQVRGSERVEP